MSAKPTPGWLRVLIAVLLVDMLGAGLYMPVSLLYFTKVSDLPLSTVGWCLSFAQLATLPLPLVIGRLVDRVGARAVVLGGLLLQGIGFLGYLWVASPWSLVLFALLTAFGQRAYWSSIFTLIAELATAPERDRAYGVAGAAQNTGVGLGAVLAALLLAVGDESAYQIAVVANAVTFLVSAVVLWRGVPAARRAPAVRSPGLGVRPLRDRPFVALVGANTVFALCSGMLALGLPVFMADALDGPGWLVAVLLGANTAALALCQVWVVKRTEGRRRTRVLVLAAMLWAGWGVLMAATLGLPTVAVLPFLLLVTAAYTLAELLHAPTSNALAAAVAPESTRGSYLATFQFSFALAGAIGPALFTQLFGWHPVAPWLVLAAAALLAGLAMLALERRLPALAVRTRATEEELASV
jgi:MFS family permease